MQTLHLYAAWIGIFMGFLAGAGLGLFFHRDGWLGGYSSWPRRMARLGHISFFGIAPDKSRLWIEPGGFRENRGLFPGFRLVDLRSHSHAVGLFPVCLQEAFQASFLYSGSEPDDWNIDNS